MLFFPQLLSGAVAQFPLKKSYQVANVANLQEDGSRYRADDANPVEVRWTLAYAHLTSMEADALSAFFQSTRGRLLSFTFLDPEQNLLSWSEDLSKPIWEKSPTLSIGTTQESDLQIFTIGGTGMARASQNLACPEVALVCFSVYARADQPTVLKLSVSSVERSFPLGSSWKPYNITQVSNGPGESKVAAFSVEGPQAQLSRMMVSAQPGPSSYSATRGTSGVMPGTRFDQDSLAVTALGKDDFSCEVRLVSRLT